MPSLKLSSSSSLSSLWLALLLERAAFYGVRSNIVLFAFSVEWFQLDEQSFLSGLGWFVFAISILYFPFGWLADRKLSHDKAIQIGGMVNVGAYLLLLFQTYWGLLGAAVLLVIGTSLIRPSLWVRLGNLYTISDRRRDGGFMIGYLMINLGAFFGIFVAGWLGQEVNWTLGFGFCALLWLGFVGICHWFLPRVPTALSDPFSQEKYTTAAILDAEETVQREQAIQLKIEWRYRLVMIGLLMLISIFHFEASDFINSMLRGPYYEGIATPLGQIASEWITPELISGALGMIVMLFLGVSWTNHPRKKTVAWFLNFAMISILFLPLLLSLLRILSWPIGDLWIVVPILIGLTESLVSVLVLSSLTRWSPAGWQTTIVGGGFFLMTMLGGKAMEMLEASIEDWAFALVMMFGLLSLVILNTRWRKKWRFLE